MGIFWAAIGLLLLGLLVAGWVMDRGVRRRGSRVVHHSDIWREVREGNRDARVVDPRVRDSSWTSWSRRNRS
ncbi:hypothetical protein [Modestobacter lacusdianchii]